MRYPERQPIRTFPKLLDEVNWNRTESDVCFVRAQHQPFMWWGEPGPVMMLAADRENSALRIPGVHTITSEGYPDPYDLFTDIMKSGFHAEYGHMNAFLLTEDPYPWVYDLLYDAEGIGNGKITRSHKSETYGDRYQLHLYSGFTGNLTRHRPENYFMGYGRVAHCPPEDIDAIVVLPDDIPEQEVFERVSRYQQELAEVLVHSALHFFTRGEFLHL